MLNRDWLPSAVNRHKIAGQLMLDCIAEAAGIRSQTDYTGITASCAFSRFIRAPTMRRLRRSTTIACWLPRWKRSPNSRQRFRPGRAVASSRRGATHAGWSRRDVDALVSTRSFFPPCYFRFPPHKEAIYAVRRLLGTDQPERDLLLHCQLRGTLDIAAIFRTADYLHDTGFRTDIPLAFVNHHEAHALSALFFTDWTDALIYTADGVGDNVSYSVRTLRDGKLECHFGDDRWLLQRGLQRSSLAWAYGHATEACGFKMFRHEGKLTGLAAFGEPKLARK